MQHLQAVPVTGDSSSGAEITGMKIISMDSPQAGLGRLCRSEQEYLPVEVRKYGDRTWAVFYGGDLLCVTLYLKGAMAVKLLVEQFQHDLREARLQTADEPTLVAMNGEGQGDASAFGRAAIR